jgi:hypothetical protein
MVDFYGTVKNAKNIPTDFDLDMNELFTSKNNQEYLALQLFSINKKNGGNSNLMKFKQLTPHLIIKYIKEFPIKNESYIDDTPTTVDHLGIDTYRDHTGYNAISKRQNWLENFRSINNKFLNWSMKYLKWNVYIPFREKSVTGSINEFENNIREVRNSNLLADDIKELNVWKQYDINTDKSKYRYGNTIPVWQRCMNVRHSDRSNEGFREGNDAYRSSLDNPIYAYDMRKVKDLMSRYQNEEWFGF